MRIIYINEDKNLIEYVSVSETKKEKLNNKNTIMT